MKTKKYYLLIAIFSTVCCTEIFTQGILTPIWMKTKFASNGGQTEGWGIDLDDSGNVYWPVSSDSASQGLDIFCYKFDSNGNSLWASPLFFGGPGTQHAFVCNAKDTALYIGGRYCAISGFSCDMQLLKVDKSNGALIWSRVKDFGNSGYDEIDGLEILNDGIYCGGWAQALEAGPYRIDLGLWKVDFGGSTIWTNYFGQTGTAEHQDGHFVVDSNFIYGAGEWGGTSVGNLCNGWSFLGKFSKTDGAFVDSTLFGYQSNAFGDTENSLGMTTDGTYIYIIGYTTPVSVSDRQIFVAKFDKNLNQLWFRNWGGSNQESARGIAVTNGYVYVAGFTDSPGYNPGGEMDAVLLAYDTAGNFITYKTWGDTLDNSFRDIAISDSSIYLSGSSGNDLGHGDSDSGFVMKINLNSFLTSVSENNYKQLLLQVFPNPFTNEINLVTDQILTNASLSIFNVYGQEIRIIKNISGQQIKFYREGLPAGIYFMRLTQDNKTTLTHKILIVD